MRIFVAMLFSLLLIGCGSTGYKPVVKYSNEIFNQPVITKVKIDPEDPSTGEYLQDEIIKMATNRLNLTITKNVDEAKSYILVNSYTINTTPETKDDNGNIIRYIINAAIDFAIKDKYGFWSKNIVAAEYVSVKDESSISQIAKDNATKLAIKKALDDFLVAVIKREQKMKGKKPKEDNKLYDDSQESEEEESTYNNESVESSSTDETSNNSEYTSDSSDNEEYQPYQEEEQEEKPLINIVVTDDETDTIGLENESSNSTKILNY